jgi:hypothetical protein
MEQQGPNLSLNGILAAIIASSFEKLFYGATRAQSFSERHFGRYHWFCRLLPYQNDALPHLIRERAPQRIRVNKEMMFWEDRDFVEAMVQASAFALDKIPLETQCVYPDFVAKAIVARKR